MFFPKQFLVVSAVVAVLFLVCSDVSAEQPPVREIRVQVVVDNAFAEIGGSYARRVSLQLDFYRSLGKRTDAERLSPWEVGGSPDALAVRMVRIVSKRYERRFGIRLVPIGAPVRVTIPSDVVFDHEYMKQLETVSCNDADIIVAFSAETLFSQDALQNPNAAPPVTGAARESSGRLFVAFSSVEGFPEALRSMADSLDHEMRHMFGATHAPGISRNSKEEKAFFTESAKLVEKNRLKTFTCKAPTAR